MNAKRIIKISFVFILFLFMIISFIDYLVFKQIKENNMTKSYVSKLISLQEIMNSLVKDVKNTKTKKELNQLKKAFLDYEKQFEVTKNYLVNFEHNMFLDLISDIHSNKNITNDIRKLIRSEESLEVFFERIFKLQNRYIELLADIDKKYANEKKLRNDIEINILKTKNLQLVKHLGDLKYYSKEALFQYKDKNSLDKWIYEVNILSKKTHNDNLKSYKKIIIDLGNDVVELEKINNIIESLRLEVESLLKENRNLNYRVFKNIEILSDELFNKIYNLVIKILVILLVVILFVAYYVNKYVGLSIDEIEEKVKEATREIEALNKEIEDTQREVVFTMGAIGERRSKETGNHVKRVAEYSKILAIYYGLDKKEAEMLKEASPMHDIGKIAIPDNILNKPGKLTDEERKIMQSHAELGYEMLKSSTRPLLKMASIVAYEHHEKYDGTGYPRGLKGEEIHIYGRITAVADVFDALGSDRVYKKAWPDEKIFELFRNERGKHFDPKLIDIFFEHLDEFLKIRRTFRDV